MLQQSIPKYATVEYSLLDRLMLKTKSPRELKYIPAGKIDPIIPTDPEFTPPSQLTKINIKKIKFGILDIHQINNSA